MGSTNCPKVTPPPSPATPAPSPGRTTAPTQRTGRSADPSLIRSCRPRRVPPIEGSPADQFLTDEDAVSARNEDPDQQASDRWRPVWW
jgi:hypothetical protein